MFWYIFILIGLTSNVLGSPKKYQSDEGSFRPDHRYYESDLPYQKPYKNKTYIPQNPIAANKNDYNAKESRFGAISYGTSGSGYGGNGAVNYGSMKLDIGGVALGALIGLGVILIIPKIAQIFSGAHGGYGRSVEEEMSSLTTILSRLDNSLAANNIDSTSCTQRIICSIVNDAVKNRKAGEASSVDEFVVSFSKNPIFTYIADGTSIKEAVEVGLSQDSEKCVTTYSKCPLTRDSIMKVISSFMPAH